MPFPISRECPPNCQSRLTWKRLGSWSIYFRAAGSRARHGGAYRYPLYSTTSKITIFESGSKSGDGSISFFINSSELDPENETVG
jgi:hypothetical protein